MMLSSLNISCQFTIRDAVYYKMLVDINRVRKQQAIALINLDCENLNNIILATKNNPLREFDLDGRRILNVFSFKLAHLLPWADEFNNIGLKFSTLQQIIALPSTRVTRGGHQPWHCDGGDNNCSDLGVNIMIYLTEVNLINGITEFRIDEKTVTFPGPVGTCIAFTNQVMHRGCANRSQQERIIVCLSYISSQDTLPYSLKWNDLQ